MEDQVVAELCYPLRLNDSCRKPSPNQSTAMLVYFMLFIALVTVVLNLFVIVSVSHFRQLHTPNNFLILSLAVADFLFGLDIALDTHYKNNCWLLGDDICSLRVYVSSVVFGVSIGDLILISVDRYVAICHPLHYSTRVTVRRVQMCVCMCWSCSAVYSALIFIDLFTHPEKHRPCYGRCGGGTNDITEMVDAVLSSIAPITVIIILYLRVFVTAVSQARAMRSHVAGVTLQHSGAVRPQKSELKAARTLGVVIVVFIMSFCPYFFLTFVPDTAVDDISGNVTLLLLYISPCMNPVIYALFYPWFRKAFRLTVTLQIVKPCSSETNMQ